jgi:arsenate reductase
MGPRTRNSPVASQDRRIFDAAPICNVLSRKGEAKVSPFPLSQANLIMKLYTYSGCGTCRKATKWLQGHGLDIPEIPIRERPPSVEDLKKMLGHFGGDRRRLFNTSGQDYRALKLKASLPEMTDAEVFSLLSKNGNLVKRPFLLTDSGGTTGFQEAEWERLLNA